MKKACVQKELYCCIHQKVNSYKVAWSDEIKGWIGGLSKPASKSRRPNFQEFCELVVKSRHVGDIPSLNISKYDKTRLFFAESWLTSTPLHKLTEDLVLSLLLLERNEYNHTEEPLLKHSISLFSCTLEKVTQT